MNTLKKLGFSLALILLAVAGMAQTISGTITNKENTPLEAVTISLLLFSDSSIQKTSITRADGRYSFSVGLSLNTRYLVAASYSGYSKAWSQPIVIKAGSSSEMQVNFALEKITVNLKAVTVTAQKQMIEVKADKTIVNVESTINATGSTALELLRKSPGIVVDNDDNISMNGRNGVQIFIDGKASPLSNADLAVYLRGLQSSQINAIELITNPSARYDAAGNGGIINIKLKKNQNLGTNASVNQGYAIGKYVKYNGGIAINNRNKNTNIFGNYNFGKATNLTEFLSNRRLGDTVFNLTSLRKVADVTHGFNSGIDFFMGKKSTVGILVNGNVSNAKPDAYTVTPILFAPTNKVVRTLISDNKGIRQLASVNFNANYRFTNGKGKDWNIDADYGRFRNKNDQQQPNAYYDAAGTTLLARADYLFISPSAIDIYSLKTDYEQDWKNGKLSMGGKASLVKSDNHFERYDVFASSQMLDINRSNQFDYNENINAIYASYSRTYPHTIMQLGLRMENTLSEGKTYALFANGAVNYSTSQGFKRRYTDLFPNVAFTFNKNNNMVWGIAYSRRIDRPRYDNLNPFEFKLDEYTFRKGNPNLIPQYSNTVTITNVYRSKLISKLSYGFIKDVFAQIVDTIDKSKNFITYKNLASQKITTLGVSYPVTYKQYTGFFSFNGYYSQYRADFGGANRIIKLDILAYNFNMQHSLKLQQGFTAEISGNYNSPSIWQGTLNASQTWNLDAGLQKTFLKGQGNIRAVVTDIFYKQNTVFTGDFAGQTFVTNYNIETRQFKLNISYRFGNTKLKAARIRSTGTDDEIKRTKGGS